MRFGREKLEVPEEFEKYYRLWKDGNITVREGAKVVGMSPSTFYRRCMEK